MSFSDFEFLKLSAAGWDIADIAKRLNISVEEAQAHADRLGLGMGVGGLFSKRLREWAAAGFIRRGWSVRLDRGEGCYRMKFRIGEETYDLTEAQMEMFVLGVEHMQKFKEQA
ncbi:hypothetical protein [Streptomyces luteogriseus]|uniref:hypothetical protein n=1 Tax=Streptomyces luteogriseus TaxID=68233 RepID=UPI0037BD6DA5